jgi:hypothetical protein
MLANGKLFRTVCGHDLIADCGSRDNMRLASLHETSYAEFVETPSPVRRTVNYKSTILEDVQG